MKRGFHMKGTNKILMLLTGLLAVTSFTSCTNAGVKEEKDLSTMVGRISYAARKYNKRITRNKILSGSKLTENSPYTIENFIKEAYVAFKDIMPKATKARSYQGYKEADTIKSRYYVDASKEEKFFISRGLIPAKQSYSYPLTEEEEKDYLQRIHTYIGKSKVDDFATYVNYDALYGKKAVDLNNKPDGEPEISIDFIDDKVIDERIDEIFNEALKSDNKYGEALRNIKSFVTDERPLENYYAKELYEKIMSIDSAEEYFDYQKELLNLTGWNDLIQFQFNELNEDFIAIPHIPFRVDEVLRDAYYYKYKEADSVYFGDVEDKYYRNVNSVIYDFDLPNSQYNEFIYDLCAFFKYMVPHIKNSKGRFSEYTSAVSDQFNLKEDDPFLTAGLDFDFPSLYEDFFGEEIGDFFEEELSDTRLFYLYLIAEAAQDPQCLPGLKFLSLYNLSDEFSFTFNYDNVLPTRYFSNWYIRYHLIAYYQTTDEYKEVAEVLTSLFEDDLKPGLRDLFLECNWLTARDREILLDKLDKMDYILCCEENGNTIDLSFINDIDPAKGALGLEMELSRIRIKASLDCVFNSCLSKDLIFFYSDPFTANAVYYPGFNKFYLYPGFVFSKDYISKLSYEELLGEFGMCIAHEMSHAFDSNGIKYDARGYRDWRIDSIISESSFEAFQEKMQLVIDHYDNCYLCPGIVQSGKTVVTEATADQVAFRLLLNLAEERSDFDYDLFFKTFAKNFVTTGNRDFLSEYKTDVHPVGQARVNKLLSNCQEFIDLYGVEEGDYLYNDPDYIFQIW